MESKTLIKKSVRSPTLQTVLMVERFIDKHSGEFKKTELFNSLPKKVMWQTFQVIIEYLESMNRIAFDSEGYLVYIWNPELYNKVKKSSRNKIMKSTKVVFIDEELKKSFDSLKENDPIKKGIKKAIKEISENAFSGRNVKKSLIPKEYQHLNNLWIYNLPSAWRLIYSVAPGEIEIISVILDWMNHKDYERKFNY